MKLLMCCSEASSSNPRLTSLTHGSWGEIDDDAATIGGIAATEAAKMIAAATYPK